MRILAVEGDAEVRALLVRDLEELLAGRAAVAVAADADDGLSQAHAAVSDGGLLALVIAERTLPGGGGGALLRALHDEPALRPSRKVLLTSRPSLRDVDDALKQGAVHGMLNRPWTTSGLREHLGAHLRPFLADHPDLRPQFADLLSAAPFATDRPRPTAPPDPGELLLDPTIDDHQVEQLMVEALDEALGRPPRLRVAPGTILIEEGEDVGGIYLVLGGEVALTRHGDGEAHLLHSRSTGPIVGLLSLTGHSRAFLQCRAVTDVVVIPVTLEQLGRALAAEPHLGALLTRVLVTSLARRLRRADELQLEVDRLNRTLAAERDELSRTVEALAEADAQLISQARLATIGELAAGIAHELNNPSAALQRAADHLADALDTLVDPASPEGRSFEAARSEPPMSTAEARAGRQALAAALSQGGLGDRALADRLWAAGVRDITAARTLLEAAPDRSERRPDRRLGTGPDHEAHLRRLEAGARAGAAVRGIGQATDRIGSLVAGLRAYLRGGSGDEPLTEGVDVAEGINDAVRLLGHRLRDASVECRFDPTPPITGRPGALQQVWTNVVANALDAAGPQARLQLAVSTATTAAGAPAVSVSVADDGPGIDPDLLERVFEPRFTTKHGQVTFGVGLGLSLSRRIVEDHGGTISADSEPGRTVFTVVLPVSPPTAPEPR
ncbi:MAG: ATP-binding protein [Acidimicrobiales bacterium]